MQVTDEGGTEEEDEGDEEGEEEEEELSTADETVSGAPSFAITVSHPLESSPEPASSSSSSSSPPSGRPESNRVSSDDDAGLIDSFCTDDAVPSYPAPPTPPMSFQSEAELDATLSQGGSALVVSDPPLSEIVDAEPSAAVPVKIASFVLSLSAEPFEPAAARIAAADDSAAADASLQFRHHSNEKQEPPAICLELPCLPIAETLLPPSSSRAADAQLDIKLVAGSTEASADNADAASSASGSDSVEADSLASLPSKEGSMEMERDSLECDDGEHAELADGFVRVELPDREVETPENEEEDPFEMDDEMGAGFCAVQQPSSQLWRTVILEESEPNSMDLEASGPSSLDRTVDSGIVIKDGSGPITQAVSQWLESAPLHEQLIASTAVLGLDEEEEDESEEEDQVSSSVPKNGLANPCPAPSSESSITDGAQLRVGTTTSETTSAGRDCTSVDDEEPLSETLDCDPAKFSVYYQLGVTVEDEEEESRSDVKALTDDSILQCPLDEPESDKQNKKKKKKTTKEAGRSKSRNSWRRILLAHRAVRSSSSKNSDCDNANKNAKRPKAGQSCCAVQ